MTRTTPFADDLSSGLPTPLFFARRDVLLGAGVGIALTASSAASAVGKAGLESADPWRFIYDERHSQAIDYAKAVSQRGVAIRSVRGDPTDVWFDELSVEWKRRPATIWGLTQPDTLFVLERLAWAAGLRVVERRPIPGADLVLWTIAAPRSRPINLNVRDII